MIKRTIAGILIIFLFQATINAQIRFQKCHLVNNDNEVISGYVKFNGLSILIDRKSQSSLYSTASGSTTHYFKENLFFKRSYKDSVSLLSITEFRYILIDTITYEKIFLKAPTSAGYTGHHYLVKLVEGELALFKHSTDQPKNNTFYYIRMKDKTNLIDLKHFKKEFSQLISINKQRLEFELPKRIKEESTLISLIENLNNSLIF